MEIVQLLRALIPIKLVHRVEFLRGPAHPSTGGVRGKAMYMYIYKSLCPTQVGVFGPHLKYIFDKPVSRSII